MTPHHTHGPQKRLFTSESVTDGHPDKMADQISDAVLDGVLAKDPLGRVACETALCTGTVLVFGEISTQAYVDIPGIVRQTIRDIGYTRAKFGFDFETCGVLVSLDEQSPDIAQGVNTGGAGDQGMMVGFACDETPELMPAPIQLAHRLARQLSTAPRDGTLRWARPDGKTQVTMEYDAEGRPCRVDTVLVSAQHSDEVSNEQIFADVQELVVNPIIPAEWLDAETKRYVNPTGRFVVGGPQGDAGLTGRKIIVDTYGGDARHGGGGARGEGRGPAGRCRSHRPQDHRRHLRRVRPAWRGRLQRQGSDQGRPQRRLCRPLGGQERRRRRPRHQVREPGRLRDPGGPTGVGDDRGVRDGAGTALPDRGAGRRILRSLPCGDHQRSPAPPADLPPGRGLRPLRTERPQPSLGADRPGRRARLGGRGRASEERGAASLMPSTPSAPRA